MVHSVEWREQYMLPSRPYLLLQHPCIFQQGNVHPHPVHIIKTSSGYWTGLLAVLILCKTDGGDHHLLATLTCSQQRMLDKITAETLYHWGSSMSEHLLSVVKRNKTWENVKSFAATILECAAGLKCN